MHGVLVMPNHMPSIASQDVQQLERPCLLGCLRRSFSVPAAQWLLVLPVSVFGKMLQMGITVQHLLA